MTNTMFYLILLNVIFLANGVISLDLLPQCKATDTACIEKSFNHVLPMLFSADPEHGIASSDPLFIDKVVGDLSVLRYKFVNTTLLGAKSVVLLNLKIDEDFTTAQYDLVFTNITLIGKYELSGKLFALPVEGSGDFLFSTGKYILNIDSKLEKVKREDGKTQVFIKSFKLKCNPVEPVMYDFKNLFNGQKDLAEVVHKYANENWLEVAQLVQDPGWTAAMDRIFHNVNGHLKLVTLEDFITK